MKNKIKILFVLNTCRNCGPVQVIFNIIRNLDRSKFDPIIITLVEEPKNSKLNEILPYISEHIFCKTSKREILFGKMKSLKKKVDLISPDVIHATGVFPDYAISKISPNNQVITMHSYAPFDYRSEFGYLLGSILIRMQYSAVKRAKKVVACSKSLAGLYHEDGFDFGYVRNGIDVKKYNIKSGLKKKILRKKIGLKDDSFIFIYAGVFTARKNIQYLLDGFIKVYGNDFKTELLLLGDGPDFARLKAKYANIKNITFVGNVKNVSEYLAASDAYISASKSEGLPNAVLEAMACGLPVLLSDIPQHREIIPKNNGRGGGLLFGLDDIDEYTNGLRMVQDCATKMKKDVRKNVYTNFNATLMSSEYQEIYKEIWESRGQNLNRKNAIKYSVIIPAYNVEKYIGRCLDSLTRQNYNAMEAIVIDDGSSDNTLKIARQYEREYKMIKVYHQNNSGLAATRKKGIDKASGVYCLMLDADDWLESDAINMVDKYINKYKNVDILKFKFVYEPSGKCNSNYKVNNKVLTGRELNQVHEDLLLTNDYNNLCNQVFERKLYQKAYNKKFQRINFGEDIIVNLGLFSIARTIIFINVPLYHYFENLDSITHRINAETITKNLSDSICMYRERLKYITLFGNGNVNEKMLKNTLALSMCEIVRRYITHGGKIDHDLKNGIENSGIHKDLEGCDISELNMLNRLVGKCILTKKYNRLVLLKPYIMARKKIRGIYHCFLRLKRMVAHLFRPNRAGGSI